MVDLEFLEEVGLTKGESKVYLVLTELGESTAGPIIKKSNLQRSAVYFCLDSLIGKGIVSFIIKNNIKHFYPENPEKLYSLIDKKLKRIETSKEKISNYIKFVNSKRVEEKEEARIFKGWNGMESAIEDISKTLKKGDTIFIMGVLTEPEVFPRFRRIIGNMNKKRIKIGAKIKAIMNEDLQNTLGADREAEPGAFIKYIPKDLQTPAVTYIYSNKVIIGIWKKEPLAVMIENKQAAKSYKNYFKVLWEIAKTKKELKKKIKRR